MSGSEQDMSRLGSAPKFPVAFAGALMIITLAGYAVVFGAFETHLVLFNFSKKFVSYDYRQFLGASKRYLPQYVHLVFLFSVLVLSKYVFVSDKGRGRSDLLLNVAVKYWIYVFLFHFPLLYLIAALTNHDRTSDFDQAFLLVAVVIGSVVLAGPCLVLKPRFDRIQSWVLERLKKRSEQNTASAEIESGSQVVKPPPLSITSAQSRFIDVVKVVSAAAVVIGHFSFAEFSTWEIPGAAGHAPRFAVPTFFVVSGYLAMLSLDRTRDGLVMALFKRYWALAYIVVPMLLIVPVMDHFGFGANEDLYRLHFRFGEKTTGGPETWFEFGFVFASSILYLNEILIFKVLGLFSAYGGVIAFSNDAFWFMCYLLPFTALLAVMCKVQGASKYVWLVVVAVVFGLPILMLSPLFFAGAIAYKIHRRY